MVSCGKILEHMALVMHKELGAMPMYSSHPEQWHKLWADFPGAWKLLIKRFAQRLRESCCPSQDGEIAEDGQFAHVSSDLEGMHTCADCGKQFASNCGLAVHMARVHGVRRPAPSYAGRDGTCASCKRGFHTRLRLVHHLSYSSPRCLEWCILHMEPMPDHDREVLDREDADQRRKDKREGRSFLATECALCIGKLTPLAQDSIRVRHHRSGWFLLGRVFVGQWVHCARHHSTVLLLQHCQG